MITASNKLLLGFLGGGVLLFAVALLVREDAAVDSVADVAAHAADSSASTPSLVRSDSLTLAQYDLDTKQLVAEGPMLIPAATLSHHINSKQSQPSGIERHPRSGNYFVVAARQCAIAEITPQGQVRAVAKLAAKRHPQAEGIAFTADHALVISDEGAGKRATLTFYPLAKAR